MGLFQIPADLPGQVKLMTKLLVDLDQSIQKLAAALAPRPVAPESDPVWRPLPITMGGQKADIVTVIASGDTAGVYGIQVGTGLAFQFRLQVNATAIFDLPLGRHLGVSPGLKVSLVIPSGATGEASVAYRVRG